MELEIQIYFPLVHNPARGNTASTFPQKEKKKGLTKKGYPRVSSKHTNAGGGREKKPLNTTVGKMVLRCQNVISARGERKNINLRPRTHQKDKMGSQT